MKVTELVYIMTAKTADAALAARLIQAVCAPFPSLGWDGEVDPESLAKLITRFVRGEGDTVLSILELVFGAAPKESSSVKLRARNILELIPPNSGTIIHVEFVSGEFIVTIDLGPGGSMSIPAKILQADGELSWAVSP
jgi:hypothetical protein